MFLDRLHSEKKIYLFVKDPQKVKGFFLNVGRSLSNPAEFTYIALPKRALSENFYSLQ